MVPVILSWATLHSSYLYMTCYFLLSLKVKYEIDWFESQSNCAPLYTSLTHEVTFVWMGSQIRDLGCYLHDAGTLQKGISMSGWKVFCIGLKKPGNSCPGEASLSHLDHSSIPCAVGKGRKKGLFQRNILSLTNDEVVWNINILMKDRRTVHTPRIREISVMWRRFHSTNNDKQDPEGLHLNSLWRSGLVIIDESNFCVNNFVMY